ncbi:type II/IV secretion system ATPase subunit [Candidatus Woesearchaeota archaeon]|nr:type II/IV secretion system ATPase subunit [Candidatus Woesearchaeota archaeon]
MPDPWSFEVIREGEDRTLRIDASAYLRLPSIEDDGITMAKVIDLLIENRDITKIVIYQKRDFEYDTRETGIIAELASVIHLLVKSDLLSYPVALGVYYHAQYAELQRLVHQVLKSDPLAAYVEVKRLAREERILMQKTVDSNVASAQQRFISMLDSFAATLEKTTLFRLAQSHLAGFVPGSRAVYRHIFHPLIKPDFMFTRLLSKYPADGEELASYSVKNADITIFKMPNTVQYLYHVMPPEFKLSEEKYELLDLAKKIMAEHKPNQSDFVNPERMREVFMNVGIDMLEELAGFKKLTLRTKDIQELAEILVRYTVGFGLIEVLLQDDKIQDISINSPMGHIPMFVVHAEFDDCKTNIVPSVTEAESWAAKLRMISGRPLDEANPILDTELELPGANVRVSTITQPLNPSGLAYSFRRHRDRPWTLPLFMKANMIDATGAGLLSFLIDGTRSILVCGTRSSGKTSFLTGLLVEIMRRYRVITVEDTLELPTKSLRDLGYNIQPLKVASALSKGSSEMDATDGIRSTLRLGDSALIVGEVRSKEAIALYEAMRVGAAANTVAGTIHADSPYGVYDRVVNDIGVPKTSFKATDICVIANPIRSADGLHKFRRITQITEVGKKWTNDPVLEGGFLDLMKYDAREDKLLPSDSFINGESEVLKTIAGNIKDFAGSWDAVWENIQLRAKIKQAVLDASRQTKNDDLLEAPFVILCNDRFHLIAEHVKEESGTLDPKRIYSVWEDWLKQEVKRRAMRRDNGTFT